MKKVLGLILAAIMLAAAPCAALVPQADADGTEIAVVNEEKTGTIVNCKTDVNVREKATAKSKLLGTAKKGEKFTVLGTDGNWVKIDYKGKNGYVYKTYIRIDVTPTEEPVEGKIGTIVNCRIACNVRKKASSDSKLLGTAAKGKTYQVLARAGDWVRIRYTSDTDGYVYKTYIRITDEGGEPTEGGYAKIVNCRSKVNVRAKASENAKIIGKAKKGAKFIVLDSDGTWVKVDYNGKTGYIHHSFIKMIEEKEYVKGLTGKLVSDADVRAKAKRSADLLGTAKKGKTFRILGMCGDWYTIRFNDGIGYVYRTHIEID